MKKRNMLPIAIALSLMTSATAFAAARISVEDITKRTAGASKPVGISNNAGQAAKDIASGLAKDINSIDVAKLNFAMRDSSIKEIAEKTLAIKQEVDALKGLDMDANASALIAAKDRGTKALAQLMEMSTARAVSAKAGRTVEQIKQDTDDALKFISEFSKVLESGSTNAIESYTKVGDKMVEARTSSSVAIDEAYDTAMKTLYGNKSEDKKKEFRGCKNA